MSGPSNYRPLSRMDMRSVFTSLGLPRTAFRSSGATTDRPPFDAVLIADTSNPDGLWLFKGADYFRFNLQTREVEEGPSPVGPNWFSDPVLQLFRTGIHSALWCGPMFPHLWVFFKDEWYVTLDSSRGWVRSEGPRGILGAWATGAWADPSGRWKTPGVPVALHGLGSEFQGKAHFFKDGQYIRHNLTNGELDLGPVPIKEHWSLPQPFTARIDMAFYGTGANKEHIYFTSGEQYVLYDFRRREVLESGSTEDEFPAFAQFVGRPQLFLVEDYSLETLVGPPHLGRLIDTRSIGAGSTIKRILVTETTDTSMVSLKKSVLETQDANVVKGFYDKLDENTATSEDSERYKYQLNAHAHGEATANSLWGGEVDATLDVQGGTDTLRTGFSQAAFSSIGSQVEEAKRQTEQKTYSSETEIQSTVRVLKKEVFEETNASDRAREYRFFELLQPYITLIALRRARLGYSDGTEPPRVVELPALRNLLERVLVDADLREKIPNFVRGELTKIADNTGAVRSLLAETPAADLLIRPNLTSTYTVPMADGTVQSILVQGIVKADRSWIEPTFTITCVQV
jgi:hypothetical protein